MQWELFGPSHLAEWFPPPALRSDIRDVVIGEREQIFPVVDERGKFEGVLTREGLEKELPVKLILVDHNELNQVPLTPVDDVLNLALGARDAAGGDPHSQDDREAVVASRCADILERTAIGAVDTDG